MITKKICLLAAILAIYASNPSFAAEDNDQFDIGYPGETLSARYEFIEANFNSETNQFEEGYFRRKHDIAIVEDHKSALEREMKKSAEYQKSWTPLLLKIAGVGFGIGAAQKAIYSLIHPLPYSEYQESIENALSYLGYVSLNVNAGIIGKIGTLIYNSTKKETFGSYYEDEQKVLTRRQGTLAQAALSFGASLPSAAIAYSLLKMANMTQERIERLQAAIALDDQMIKALPNVPIQQ